MNRLCVFSMYDKRGKVQSYREYLIKELKQVSSDLIVVVNGKLEEHEKEKIRKYTNKIYCRENEGFDSGAYKDVIFNYLGRENVQKYDELILCNDTFFGPFISFEEIFCNMKKRQADFWGLNCISRKLFVYLESYFLVFRKRILIEDKFFYYLENFIDEKECERSNIVAVYEIGLFRYLFKSGYKYASFVEMNSLNIY